MGLTFQSITTAGASGGALSDTFQGIGSSPTDVMIKVSTGTGGTHYTVANGRRFVGYLRCNSGSPIVNGTTFDQNDFTSSQNYNSGNAIIRLNAGATVGSSSGYIAIIGCESGM
tara:strand:- start:823 stop:1164 length:342 start_codon:yes stop_codon:yes gene_type:complete